VEVAENVPEECAKSSNEDVDPSLDLVCCSRRKEREWGERVGEL